MLALPRRPRRLRSLVSTLTLLAAMLGTLPMAQAAPQTSSLEMQRATFKQAYANARQGNQAWRTQAAALKDYPLYPWLPAAMLEHDLAQATPAQVRAYLQRYPDLLPAQDLRRHYLTELARRQDWSTFLDFYRAGHGHRLTCLALQARLAQGQTLQFKRDLAKLWQSPSLPAACTPVQEWAHAHGLLTTTRLWGRIERAFAAGRGGTVAALARWLSGADQVQAQHLAQALRDPLAAAQAASDWTDTARNRQAVTRAMVTVARRDSDRADALWPKLRAHFHFSSAQTNQVRAAMALYVATDFSADALRRLAALPAAAQTPTTRAWRVRVALAKRDWAAALKALDALDTGQKQEGQWTYLRGRVLQQLGQTQQAAALFAQVAGQATYYGFLAADQAGLPYTICPRPARLGADAGAALRQNAALNRAFELYAVGMLAPARRVWNRALRQQPAHTRQMAAQLAWQRGWYNRAIRTFSHGTLKQFYTQRFPLGHEGKVTHQSAAAGIDPAWAYAIIRAESAWAPDAHSGADARGLMQLLPATARHVAKRQGLPRPGNLYDPDTNITLGTHYLGHLAARYGGAPWLATAAYNAGPSRVDAWLAARGALPPDLFVATIPFHETRAYVMRVLAYSVIYDWRLHGDAVVLAQRMPRFGQPYTPPNADTPRKSVACAANTRRAKR